MQALPARGSSLLSSFLINYFNSIDGRKLRRAPFAQDAPREMLPRWFFFVAKTTEETKEKHVFWGCLTQSPISARNHFVHRCPLVEKW